MSIHPNPSDQSVPKEQPQTTELLFAEIERAIEESDFKEAERLRDKLIETNPMAISEAIKTAELIETGMSAAIDKDHLAIWPELYNQLSTEERNCLFHSMKKFIVPEKRMLLKYGSLNNRLFFLEKGSVIVGIPGEDKKLKIVAQLGRGDVFGEYTFTTISLCSATAVTKTNVQGRYLEGREAESWKDKHPGLYDKVLDFCKKHGKIDQIEERKEKETHTHQRYTVQGHAKAILLNKKGQKTEVNFNGELEEISRSGTSFSIHCNKRSTVKQLLTRSMFLTFTCGKKGKEITFSSVGRVVRVSFLLYNDYLLHVGFHNTLPEELDGRLAP